MNIFYIQPNRILGDLQRLLGWKDYINWINSIDPKGKAENEIIILADQKIQEILATKYPEQYFAYEKN